MSKIKILQLFSRYLQYGGEEGSVFRIGDTLQERFDVEYFLASTEEMLRGSKLLLPLKSYRNTSVLKRLEKYQRVGHFDCWQIHNVFPAISPGAYTLAAKLGIPIIHFLHNYRMGCVNGYLFTQGQECEKCISGAYLHGALGRCWRNSYAQSSIMALLLADVRRRGLFQQVASWIAISHAQKALHVKMGIPEEKIVVLHHFLNHDEKAQPPAFPEAGYALFIGRLSAEKGVDRLLDAWSLLDKNCKLMIAGSGPELESLQKKANDLNLTNVRFLGFIPSKDHEALWAGACFSVVPSVWQEPFGMVVLEAWAKGRPVVAHRIGALPEIINDGENGFLADPYNYEDLARTLQRAFSSAKFLPEMGQSGRLRLATYYGKSRWLDEIEQVYRNAGIIQTNSITFPK